MDDRSPDFWRNLRQELVAGRHWIDRAVVLAYAVLTGLVVVGFTLLSEAASHGFEQIRTLGKLGTWLPLLWTPALTVAVLWWTWRFVPAAMGSGIPQVVAALDDGVDPARSDWLVGLRVSLHKIVLVSGGLLGGLSIARRITDRRFNRITCCGRAQAGYRVGWRRLGKRSGKVARGG